MPGPALVAFSLGWLSCSELTPRNTPLPSAAEGEYHIWTGWNRGQWANWDRSKPVPGQPSPAEGWVCCKDTWFQHITSTHSYRGRAWLCDLIQHPKMMMVHPKCSFCEVLPRLPSAPSLIKAVCPARVIRRKVCAGFCRDGPREPCGQADRERRLQYVQTIYQTSRKNQHCRPIVTKKTPKPRLGNSYLKILNVK